MQSSSIAEVINDISKAINGEYHAFFCYEILSNQAPNAEIKNEFSKLEMMKLCTIILLLKFIFH